jgi:ABC-type phosphate/phosphonate transport system ATPase subunit
MKAVKIDLTHCYGIKRLTHEFDYSKKNAFAIYAPNGVMKSSLARTFEDIVLKKESSDRIFKTRATRRTIVDDQGKNIEADRVLVVGPYDPDLGVSNKASTLLLQPEMKAEYDALLKATADAKTALLEALKTQSKSKKGLEAEISQAVMQVGGQTDAALIRLKREVAEQRENLFANVPYDTVFNDKVMAALNTKGLKDAVHAYMTQYNTLLAGSTYFKRGTFDYYNAGQIADSLVKNGFFDAKHSVNLNAAAGSTVISTVADLQKVISDEKAAILTDATLKKNFEDVANQLGKNTELRDFCEYVRDDEAFLARLANPEQLRQEVIKSYLKAHEHLYDIWMSAYDAAAERRKEIERAAAGQQSQWKRVIEIFNDRFTVPFRLEAKNELEVTLGQTSIIELGFTYIDGQERVGLGRSDLLQSLSTGEKKALYILNVIFEIETRIKGRHETLIIVDDIADSFDYQNKYAIIQYLKDISEEGIFKMIVMTHNFDFFRTIESRFVAYSNCLMATRSPAGVTLQKAAGIKNVFVKDWKVNFFKNDKKKIASIPFLRNLVEMTVGEGDATYLKLTSLLHWKADTAAITVGNLDGYFNTICATAEASLNQAALVVDLITAQADDCLANQNSSLENKIVLAIACRLLSERFMINMINDPAFVASITTLQGNALTSRYKKDFPAELGNISTLDKVSLMTPENIHVNSFMYEPIIDMSDDNLRNLYTKVKALA